MQANEYNSRRHFLNKLMSSSKGIFAISLFTSAHAKAIDHLMNMQPSVADEIQNSLLTEPKKEILIAEVDACGSMVGPAKTKCMVKD